MPVNLHHTWKSTYLQFHHGMSYQDRVNMFNEYLSEKYGANYNASYGKLSIKNTEIYISYDRINTDWYSSKSERIKIMVANEKGRFGIRNKANYLRISEGKKYPRINISKFTTTIEDFAIAKAERQKQRMISEKKKEFAAMAMAGKISAELGVDIEIDNGYNDARYFIAGGKFFETEGFSGKDYRKKCMIHVTRKDEQTYSLEVKQEYGGIKFSNLPIGDAKNMIKFFMEENYLTPSNKK